MATNLSEQQRQQLDSIVQRMVANGENDTNIRTVVEDFKSKYGGSDILGQQGNQADIQSSQTYKPLFPYDTTNPSIPQKTGLSMIGNVPSSLWSNIKNIGTLAKDFVMYSNPISSSLGIGQDKNPVTNVGKIIGGAGVQAGKALGVVPKDVQTPEFEAAVDFLGSRYGSWENFQRTANNDPVGVALDLAALVSTGAGALGKTEELSQTTGNILSKVKETPSTIKGKILGNTASDLESNVGRALPMVGKYTPAQALSQNEKAINALQEIANRSKDILVKDASGVLKTFDPVKATFAETLQAWKQTRDQIYNEYSQLASSAGDAGYRITNTDFQNIFKDLNTTIKSSTSGFSNVAKQLKNDMIRIFKDNRYKGQGMVMKEIRPTDFQQFLEELNTMVKADPRTPQAKVAAELSQKIRGIMDEKILSATGEEYQQLRTMYQNLKSIEQPLINQFKRVAKGNYGKGFTPYIEGFGTIDTFLGALSGSPTELARGGALFTMGKIMEYLKNPENNLRHAFDALLQGTTKKIPVKPVPLTPLIPAAPSLNQSNPIYVNQPKQ